MELDRTNLILIALIGLSGMILADHLIDLHGHIIGLTLFALPLFALFAATVGICRLLRPYFGARTTQEPETNR